MGLASWLTSRKRPVKSVLEIGCGPASTPLFLDRGPFPELETLISLETSEQWAHTICTLYGGDKRLKLMLHAETETLMADELAQGPFDIALVDGADNTKRVEVIPTCLDRARFVVVHDAQEPALRAASLTAPFSVFSVIECPWTAVLSKHEEPFALSTPALPAG
jgi:predicted O-methyltransferase YrrM